MPIVQHKLCNIRERIALSKSLIYSRKIEWQMLKKQTSLERM